MSASFLDRILDEIRVDLGRSYLDGLPAEPARRPPSLRDRVERMSRNGPAILIEYKRRSPGRDGPPTPPLSLDAFTHLAAAPQVGAVSAVACRPEFFGSPETVARVVESTDKPVLFKDFVIDPVQVRAAHRAGAAAILLIARLETEGRMDRPLKDLADQAHRLGLEVLVEVHAENELNLARGIGADLYGVNVRDLDSLRMEADVARATLRSARSLRPLVLSGIASAADARPFVAAGAVGMLVGAAVHTAPDPRALLRELAAIAPVEAA